MLLILSILFVFSVSSVLLLFPGQRNKLDSVLLFVLYSIAQVFVVMLLCGVLGLLSTAMLFLAHMSLFIISTIYYYTKFLKKHNKKWPAVFIDIYHFWKDIVVGCRGFCRKDFVKVALLILLLAFLYVSFLNVFLPVHDWDGFMYHLFLPANWLQQGSLDIFPAAPQLRLDKWVHFPANLELFTGWHLALAGSDDLVEFFQFPVVIAGLLSLLGIARMFGVVNRFAVWVMPLFLTIPIVFCQLNSSYVDGALALLFFTGFYCLVRGAVLRSRMMLSGGTVAAALLLGSKASAPLFFAVLFAVVFFVVFVLCVKKGTLLLLLRRISLQLTLAALIAVLLGGFFYIRNYAVRGNPFYPYELKLMGKKIFSGIDPVKQTTFGKQKERTKFLIERYQDKHKQFVYNYYGHNFAGHGPVPYVVGIPALLLVPLFFVMRRKWRELFAFLVLGGGCLLTVAMLPTLFPRFTIILDGFAVLSIVVALGVLWGTRALLQLLLCLAMLYSLIVSVPMNFHMKWHIKKAVKSKRPLSAADSPYSGREFRRIDRLVGGKRVVFAYSGLMLPYPLFGRILSRKVLYIKADKYTKWRKRVRDAGVQFIVLGKPGFRYKEQYWVEGRPRQFRRVLSNGKLDLYLVVTKENLKLYREILRDTAK